MAVMATAVVFGLQGQAQDVPEGTTIKVTKSGVSVQRTDDKGRDEVLVTSEATQENKSELKMPKAAWKLGIAPGEVPGKGALKGVLIREVVVGSGMLEMRPKKGGPDSNDTSYRAETGDILISVDSKLVNSGKDITVILNNADTPQDVEVVVKDRKSGKLYRYYVSASAL